MSKFVNIFSKKPHNVGDDFTVAHRENGGVQHYIGKVTHDFGNEGHNQRDYYRVRVPDSAPIKGHPVPKWSTHKD